MKTDNKTRCIKALKELSFKYKNPLGKSFFSMESCPLCRVFHRNSSSEETESLPSLIISADCLGCPLANKGGYIGCCEFYSYKNVVKKLTVGMGYYVNNSSSSTFVVPSLMKSEFLTSDVIEAFYERAKFFDKIILIVELWSNDRFTKAGWKYSEEIDRSW